MAVNKSLAETGFCLATTETSRFGKSEESTKLTTTIRTWSIDTVWVEPNFFACCFSWLYCSYTSFFSLYSYFQPPTIHHHPPLNISVSWSSSYICWGCRQERKRQLVQFVLESKGKSVNSNSRNSIRNSIRSFSKSTLLLLTLSAVVLCNWFRLVNFFSVNSTRKFSDPLHENIFPFTTLLFCLTLFFSFLHLSTYVLFFFFYFSWLFLEFFGCLDNKFFCLSLFTQMYHHRSSDIFRLPAWKLMISK